MDRIELDDIGSDAGLFERVMLHETLTPGMDGYVEADSLKAMRLMRQVFANRLKNKAYFGGNAVHTALDLLRIGGQFGEFSAYPKLNAEFMKNVTQIMGIANNPKHPGFEDYRKHVENAKLAATEIAPPADAIIPNVVCWRTQGSKGSGGYMRPSVSLQRNTFYVLTPGLKHKP